jgi:NAD dependent epimerase/dehydratase family enzyme
MGQALLLDSIRLVPQTLVDAGFEHQHPDLGAALKSMLQRS